MKKEWVLVPAACIALSMIVMLSFSLVKDTPAEYNANNPDEEQTPRTQTTGQAVADTPHENANTLGSGNGGGGSSSSTYTITPPGEEQIYCTPESRLIEECEPYDHPVCGWFDPSQVSCDEGPCVRSTFPNECEACITPTIAYWTEGECPLHL